MNTANGESAWKEEHKTGLEEEYEQVDKRSFLAAESQPEAECLGKIQNKRNDGEKGGKWGACDPGPETVFGEE